MPWFLGIHISRNQASPTLSLCQESYVENWSTNSTSTWPPRRRLPPYQLMINDQFNKHGGQATPQEIQAYQQRVGSINFAAVITRLDVSFAASKLSEFLINPSNFHLECVDWTIKYLGHTKHLSIQFNLTNHSTVFLGSSDASFADDPLTRYSSPGYAFIRVQGEFQIPRTCGKFDERWILPDWLDILLDRVRPLKRETWIYLLFVCA